MGRIALVVIVSVALLVGCASDEVATRDYTADVAQLAQDAWDHMLEQSPYLQNRQGLLVTEVPDLTEEEAARQLDWSRRMLQRIDAIPLAALSHEDALTVECLRWDNQIALEGEPYYWHQFPITPYSAGYLATFAQMMLGAYTFEDPAETGMYIRLVGEFADYFDQLIAHTEGQMERGIYMSRPALPGIVGLFGAMRGGMVRGATTVSPERLEAIPETEREAFAAEVDKIVAGRIEPAIDALIALLESDDYQSNAPDAVGASQYPDGEAYYRHLVRANTTMSKTPEELHEFGKQRVAELEADMASIREELGFEGTKEEFHDMLRTDERFTPYAASTPRRKRP